MKKSPYKRRTKKKDKPCPPDKDGRKYSMQETGEKDKNGKPIMKCQLDSSDNKRPGGEDSDPGKQTGPTKVPSRPATKM